MSDGSAKTKMQAAKDRRKCCNADVLRKLGESRKYYIIVLKNILQYKYTVHSKHIEYHKNIIKHVFLKFAELIQSCVRNRRCGLHPCTLTWKLGAYLARFNVEVRLQDIPQEHQGNKTTKR